MELKNNFSSREQKEKEIKNKRRTRVSQTHVLKAIIHFNIHNNDREMEGVRWRAKDVFKYNEKVFSALSVCTSLLF